ncbi:MAG TPA: hypothetical protein VE776_03930 [Actinomycetota bacterium]|jgi:hypothetical protein|nr:hypothetical protein [Actinomycetota bacterium]
MSSRRLPRERLAALAGEEYHIIGNHRRSFLLAAAARQAQPPSAPAARWPAGMLAS